VTNYHRNRVKPVVSQGFHMDTQQQKTQSAINDAFTMAAVDACAMLRKWSDSKDDTQITPFKIGEFQQELTQHFAAIYFGTHSRLEAIETSR